MENIKRNEDMNKNEKDNKEENNFSNDKNFELKDSNNNKAIEDIDIEKLIKEKDELKDQVLRLAADIENFRKRVIKEKQEIVEYANEKLLQKLLPLLDDLESAIEAGKKNADIDGLLKGIEMIYQKAIKIFEEVGVKQIEDSVGKQFDIDLHESIMHIPSNKPENEILQLVQKGYTYNDKVIRYAKVITSAGNLKDEDEKK